MIRTAIVAISRRGAVLSQSLAAALDGDKTLYIDRRFAGGAEEAVPFELPVRPLIHQAFDQYQRLVLFMSTGAAVRLLAPLVQDKSADPAVVCVDDAGRFAVSLLSGHLGGADLLAQDVAEILGATPVITSASHVTSTLSVALLGREFDWKLVADSPAITRASAAVVNGEQVGIYQQAGETNWWPPDKEWPDNLQTYHSLEALANSPCTAALVITDRVAPTKGSFHDTLGDRIVVLYRPCSLVVGIGCRRGVPAEELEELLLDTFRRHNLALESIKCLATAELKKDEPGIIRLTETYGVELRCYSSEELNSMFPPQPPVADQPHESRGPTPSQAAHRLLGLWGVSEPAALLASGSTKLLVTKKTAARATIAVARTDFQRR